VSDYYREPEAVLPLSFVKLPRHEVYFAETVYIARYAPDRNACVAQAMKKRVGGQRGSKAQSQNA